MPSIGRPSVQRYPPVAQPCYELGVRSVRSRLMSAVMTAMMAAAALGGSGCGDDAPPASTTVLSLGSIAPHQGPRSKLPGFGEITITVIAADGTTRTFCLLLADSDDLRKQGLMFVTDPTLGGYEGMLFLYENDDANGFWMRNTRLPLSIVYLREDGSTLSMTDMAPCPDSEVNCPTYPPGGRYRSTIEVVQGGLGRLGISANSKVIVGERSCADPPA